MKVHSQLTFGAGGNAQSHQLTGWSIPEHGFTWIVDQGGAIRVPAPTDAGALALEMDLVPFVASPVPSQRLSVWCGNTLLGATILDRAATLCFDIPPGAHTGSGELIVTLACPDAAIPASLGLGDDQRRLGLMVRAMRLVPASAARPTLRRSLAPLRIAAPTPSALDEAVRALTGMDTADLLRGFESLGHNCEFGLMQRDLDAEPLGLLRFGGIEPAALLAGLDCAFAGIDDPHGLGLESGRMNGRAEYLVRDARFGVRIHTGQFLDEVPPEAVDLFRMARHLGFLQRHFAEGLSEAERIFVLHHPDLHDRARALPILNRLRVNGDNTLLYVTEHPTVPPGTIVIEQAHLLHGYIDRLVPMNEAKKINLGAWVSLCANAYCASRLRRTSPP